MKYTIYSSYVTGRDRNPGREEVGGSAGNSVENSIYPENTREPGRYNTVYYMKSKLINFDGRFHLGLPSRKYKWMKDRSFSFIDNSMSIKNGRAPGRDYTVFIGWKLTDFGGRRLQLN